MIKKILFFGFLFCLSSISLSAQDRFFSKTGTIVFDAGGSESITAENNKVVVMYDSKTSNIEFSVLIKGFKFEKALMEEHFNDNYMDSSKFPKANFKGTVSGKVDTSKDGAYPVTVSGKLTIKGVTKDVTTKGTINVKGPSADANADFKISLEDYGISIPAAVGDKVSNEAKISVKAKMMRMMAPTKAAESSFGGKN